MEDNSISVYNLITKLCSKYGNIHTCLDLKEIRSQCYEILLSKRFPEKDLEDELEDNADPVCHLLAWQYQLMTKYTLPQHAEKLRLCCEKLQELNVFNDPTYSNVITFLLQLRKVPARDNGIMVVICFPCIRVLHIETTLNKHCTEEAPHSSVFAYFDENKFQLPEDRTCGSAKFKDEHFKLHNKKIGFKTTGFTSATDFLNARVRKVIKKDTSRDTGYKDEGYESPTKSREANIWELASFQPPSEHRTWETFGSSSSFKELPFLCESGPQSTMWLHNLSSNLENLIMENYAKIGVARRVITNKQFVRDVKYLLVGMESKTFTNNEKGNLSIVPGTCLEGLGPGAIESYCKDLIFCSNCYRGLNNLCTPEQLKSKAKPDNHHSGYIFAELCQSIRRYLSYYRIAVLSISDSINLLTLHERTRQLRTYITVLASVCKVGPFMESGHIPHGVALLNYLYQKVMSLTNTNVLMVLYSILYPCCQVYFSRFLQQWILEGNVQDPYGEFFINVHPKYILTRGRTYWTRSYTLREDIVPDFITDLRADILFCGKAMNLLKTCIRTSPLCLYLTDKRPEIITCCLMAEQIATIEQNNYYYYLEATALCGPRISLSQIVMSSKEPNVTLLNLIVKKRAATLHRIELERRKEIEKQNEKKKTEMIFLQEQYAEALRQKQIKQAEELEEEIKIIEQDIRLRTLQDRIIQEEASNLMQYYNKLFEASESRRLFFEKRIQELKRTLLEDNLNKPNDSSKDNPTENANNLNHRNIEIDKSSVTSSNSTEDVFHSAEKKSSTSTLTSDFHSFEDLTENKSEYTLASSGNSDTNLTAGSNLDIINANSIVIKIKETSVEEKEEIIDNTFENVVNVAIENYKAAQRNKAKVLAQEMGIIVPPVPKRGNIPEVDTSAMTEAQRNKLKVLSSEFGLDIRKTYTSSNKRPPSAMEINRNRMMSTSDCFLAQDIIKETKTLSNNPCDNENFLNKNILSDDNMNEDTTSDVLNSNVVPLRKQGSLSLDFTKLDNTDKNKSLKAEAKTEPEQAFNLRPKGPKFELDKVSPMSIDSTPLSGLTTPSSRLTINDFGSQCSTAMVTATTANTHVDEGFKFEMDQSESYANFQSRKSAYNIQTRIENTVLSQNISNKDAKAVSSSCLKFCLQQSISIPLITQIKLVTNELLKYFINDLQYLKHLKSLRNYFFLLDGEFGRNITEGLFEKLYDANFPMELINCHTLQVLVYKALDYSTKFQENSDCLSFRINNLPKIFDLGDPDVFDCISLTYKTGWPLNILLPSDTISRYDEVFKFLLKLHRISWVLQNIFQDLKSLVKEAESHKTILMMSPEYRRLHQCRHVMTHFIQTLQSYVVGEVLQSSWEIFEKNLESVVNIDQMYALHTNYIKNILFMCLLNQKSAPLRKVLHSIFVVILKFYDYLRSRPWKYEDGVYIHPNFKKLENIFGNFEDLVLFLFKVGHKVVKSGYQPHLMQLLDMLDVNNYYSKKRNVTADCSST